jgi:hypothetical protein
MKPPEQESWREEFWRRQPTAEQLAAFRAAHPDASDAALEAALTDALTRLPEAPVPSNFTARVLQTVERETRAPVRPARDWSWLFRVLVPRAAVALLVLGGGLWLVREHRARQRLVIADSLKAVAAVPALPSPQALADFEVIDALRRLEAQPAADRELIALLQ